MFENFTNRTAIPCSIRETVSLAGGVFLEKLIGAAQSYWKPHGFFIFFTYQIQYRSLTSSAEGWQATPKGQ